MVAVAEHLGRLHRGRIDAVDDRAAVRAVLGDRHPDVLAVEIDAARVVRAALAELEVGEQLAVGVELEQMADAFAGVAVVAVHRLRKARRGLGDLDRRHVEVLADADHPLRMLRVEIDLDRRDRLPDGAARQHPDAIGDDGVGSRGFRDNGEGERARDRAGEQRFEGSGRHGCLLSKGQTSYRSTARFSTSDVRSAIAIRVASVASCSVSAGALVVPHAVDEMERLAQERVLETLPERRRRLGADAVRVGDLDAVHQRVAAHDRAGPRCR